MAIRVCEMITELRPAGAERCVYELATRLDRGRFAVEVAALSGGPVADALRDAGVPVHLLGSTRARGALGGFGLARWLRERRFDLLHTHLFHADLVGRLAGRRAGVPHMVHSIHVAEKRRRPLHFLWPRLSAGSCDRFVAVSAGVRDWHAARAHLSADRYTVIHNGIDVDRYAPDPAARARLRAEWGLGEGELACVFTGRLDVQKGLDTLLEGFSQAAGLDGRLRLVLAGRGPLEARVHRRIIQGDLAGRARALGFRPDVPAILSAGDIFCQPSRWEGFCLAAAEAQAAALPVVGTDVEGLNEVVADGQTGLLVPVGDAAAFAASLLRLARDPALGRALGQAGRQRMRSHFTLDRFVTAHAALYEQLVTA